MTSRKILIAIIAVLLIVVGVGLYFLLFARKNVPTGTTQTGQAGSLPNTGTQSNPGGGANDNTSSSATNSTLTKSFGIILNEPVLAYFVSATNTVTAVEPGGKVVQVANGQENTISSVAVPNILSASFSYDGAKILLSFGTTTNPQASVFDVAKQTWTPLTAGLQSPTWSPSDYRIAYYTVGAQGAEAFATINAASIKPAPTALTTLHATDLAMAWPVKNQIIFYTKPSAAVAGSAWLYDLQKGALTPITTETPGLDILWSGIGTGSANPMGLEFISGASSLGGVLSLVNDSGSTMQWLKFITLPSKCAFASATTTTAAMPATSTTSPSNAITTTSTPYLFCGIPRNQTALSGSHLPDDYNQMAIFTSDDIYRVNLNDGSIDTVFNDPSQNLDISNVAFFNNTLFFINRYDQKLYGVQLSEN